MTSRPYELLARFRNDGTIQGVQVRTIETVSGRDYESDPQPLSGTDDPAFAQFASAFSAAVVAERDSLAAQVTGLTTEKDALAGQVTTLTAERDALAAEVEALKNPPFDPRIVHPYAFMQRYTLDERIAILQAAKTDVQVELILAELQTVSRVRLDVEATQHGVNYLASIGVIAADRIQLILADATAGEAP